MTELFPGTAHRLLVDVADVQSRGRLPSMAAGVVRDGRLVWSAGRGEVVRREAGARPDADTQYKIGSVTKTMTAALVMLARERGDLALSDAVGRFLPEGPFADATLRQLLAHASGITAEPHGSWWERSEGVDRARLVEAHAGADRVLDTGERHHYSNLGYGILGEVVAEVTGGTWFGALEEQVLRPLAMTRTSYQGLPGHAEGFAVDYLTGELTAEPLPDTGVMAPAGQLWSTVGDLATWLVALTDPEHSVLSAESLKAMRTPQAGTPEDRAGQTYGLGVSLLPDRGRVLVGHGGSMPGFCCGVQIDPDTGVGAIVLTNGAYGLDDLPRRMVATVLECEPPAAEVWVPAMTVPPDARDVVGLWHWGHAPSMLRLDGEELTMEPVGSTGRTLRFRRLAPDTWLGVTGYHTGETLRAVRNQAGAVSHLEVATFVYTRTPYDPDAPIPGGAPPRDF